MNWTKFIMFPENLAYTEKPLSSRKITNQFENLSQIYEDISFVALTTKLPKTIKTSTF